MINYAIINTTDINLIDFNCTLQNADTVRYNLAMDKFIVKWKGDTPNCIVNLGVNIYSHNEIIEVVNNIEWQVDEIL